MHNKPKVFILTEGGKEFGFGHITRCLSLAQAFQTAKIPVEFILNADNSAKPFVKKIKSKIFNWAKNSSKLDKIIKNNAIIIIDSYRADLKIYKHLNKLSRTCVYLDDYKRLNYPAGILINPSLSSDKLKYRNKNIDYLLGPKFTLLRKEFWGIPKKKINDKIKNILITFGGSDTKGMTQKILKLLKKNRPHLKKYVVIGKSFKNAALLQEKADINTRLFYSPEAKTMKQLMFLADIAISAGGQTLNELARLGVPTIGICICKNQELNLQGYKNCGFLKFAGNFNDRKLNQKIINLLVNLSAIKIRQKVSFNGSNFIDGKGAQRAVKYILGFNKIYEKI